MSDFPGLQINTFTTNDGVKLAYWEAGEGEPLIFIPGWSANGVLTAPLPSDRGAQARLDRLGPQR